MLPSPFLTHYRPRGPNGEYRPEECISSSSGPQGGLAPPRHPLVGPMVRRQMPPVWLMLIASSLQSLSLRNRVDINQQLQY